MSDNALAKMRAFVASFPDWDIFGSFTIDYTDNVPDCAGLFPGGLVEVQRHADIVGNKWVENQYNFALYTNLEKAPGEDAGATYNADWVMSFQEWVQEQSATGKAPMFGDEPKAERITAQNGAIYSAEDEGTALYVVQLSVNCIKHY